MDIKEQYEQYAIWVNELIEEIDGQKANIPEKYTYKYLQALFMLADYLDGGRKLYELIYDFAIKYGIENIHRKSAAGEKIKIVFVAISAAEWASEQLYYKLRSDDRIECYIVISPLVDRD